MMQPVPGLLGEMAPAPPVVQAPTPVPGLLGSAMKSPSPEVAAAAGNLQGYLANPLQAMTYATLSGTAGRGPAAWQTAAGGLPGWDNRGGFSDNSGLADVASRATSLGGFLADALSNVAAIANPTPLGWAGIGYGIANNNPTLGIRGLLDAIGLGGGSSPGEGFGGPHGDAGIGGGGIGNGGGQSTSDGSQGDTA